VFVVVVNKAETEDHKALSQQPATANSSRSHSRAAENNQFHVNWFIFYRLS
ncbi:hypothetical protein KR093_004142, partial [Drosophila rubida]